MSEFLDKTDPRSHGIRYIALIMIVAVFSGSCGSARSTEAFCSTLHEETERLSAKYQERSQQFNEATDPFTGLFAALGTTLEAQGDMVVMMERLARVAPDGIEPDVTFIHEQLQRQMESLSSGSDPFTLLLGGIAMSFQLQGSFERFDEYSARNCSTVGN